MKTKILLSLVLASCMLIACRNGSDARSSSNTDTDATAYNRAGAINTPVNTGQRWSVQQANNWYTRYGGWVVGCNFTPATAINELEMWQAETFDTARIDLELGWAQKLGFNMVRVFLHNLLWQQDSTAFLNRMDQFLTVADRHKIGVMFVFFDGCWNPDPALGKQPEPRPHVHNSGWVQSPGAKGLKDTASYAKLQNYLQGVMTHFKDDPRVSLWDLFNEPDNDNGGRFANDLGEVEKYHYAFKLLKDAFVWAREVNPSQPLTVAPWHREWKDSAKMDPMDKFMFENSDVISFHSYDSLSVTAMKTGHLQRYGRPIICSEYMARPTGSTFENILPYFKKQHVGALNWGFVSGKTQTIYPWDSWQKKYSKAPDVWFHDMLYQDGRPFDPKEVEVIKSLTLKKK